jgi:hypothetical protein
MRMSACHPQRMFKLTLYPASTLRDANKLLCENVEPLVQSIEESLAAVDERCPSVHFPDAA